MHSLFADSKVEVTKQAVLYCIGSTASPSAILVWSISNRFARICETSFRFNKLIAWNRKILNRFQTVLLYEIHHTGTNMLVFPRLICSSDDWSYIFYLYVSTAFLSMCEYMCDYCIVSKVSRIISSMNFTKNTVVKIDFGRYQIDR